MDADASERGVIGERVRITFTREISNARVGDYCEVQGASRISNTSLMSSDDAPTFIGSDVIIENSIVAQGASVVDGAKVDSCFVGENVHVGKGFTAISSLFFANCFLDNGEANASFLGPFCTARHKSTFLVGGVFLFYDAAAGVNQSNHLYKTGPLHWGRFDRGAKTTNNSVAKPSRRHGNCIVARGPAKPQGMRHGVSRSIATEAQASRRIQPSASSLPAARTDGLRSHTNARTSTTRRLSPISSGISPRMP